MKILFGQFLTVKNFCSITDENAPDNNPHFYGDGFFKHTSLQLHSSKLSLSGMCA